MKSAVLTVSVTSSLLTLKPGVGFNVKSLVTIVCEMRGYCREARGNYSEIRGYSHEFTFNGSIFTFMKPH